MKRPILLIFIFINVFNYRVIAQEIIHTEKKIYVSPDHKIFIGKSQPAYFYITTSPGPNAQTIRLKNYSTTQQNSPVYFETEGKNLIYTPYAVDTITKQVVLPRLNIQFQLYVDGQPPKTRILYDSKKESVKDGIHYMPDSVNVGFASSDNLSGVDKTYFSLDHSNYKPFDRSFVLIEEKQYHITYYSVDHTGNVETLKEITFSVDKTPPVSKLEIIGEKYKDILSGNTQLKLTAEDNLSGVKRIYISVDDSVFHPYLDVINTATMIQGDHKIFYYAMDKVQNIEKVQTYDFYVDKTPPQVIEEVIGKTFMANGKEYSAGTSKLKITSFDNKAGVRDIYYSINNAPYVRYEKPIVLSGYKGTLMVNSYAVDNVGNKSLSDFSNSRKNGVSYIDLTGPWVGHSFKGPLFTNRDTVFINHKTNIILEAKDDESGVDRIEFQIDSSDLKIYATPFSINQEGTHHISMYGYDHTENLTRQVFDLVVDTTGPEIFERFSSPSLGTVTTDGQTINEYPNTVVVFLSATDNRSGYNELWYQLNNSPVQLYLKDIRGFIPGKKNIIKAIAIDKLGNKTEKVIEFTIR